MGATTVDLALRVVSDTAKVQAGLDQTTTKTSKLGKAGAIAGKALAAGLAIGAAAAFKFAKGAAEDAAAAEQLALTLKKSAGATDDQTRAVEDWITAQGKALGIADDQLRPALSSLVTATKDIGQAQMFAGLAMDISTKKGKSLQSVADKLAKAYTTGNVAALAQYGVEVKKADGSTRSLEAVTRDLTKTYAGSASTAAETVTGKYARAKLRFDELGETIGYKLIPFMLKAADAGIKTVDWIERNQTTVTLLVGALGSLLAITFAVSKAMQAWAAITRVLAVAQALLNIALTANPIGLIVIGIAALVAGLILAYKKSETFHRIVDAAFHGVQAAASFAFNWIKSHWKIIFVIITGPIGLAVLLIIKYRDKITSAFGAAIDWVKSHWKLIVTLLTGPIGRAVIAIVENWDKIVSAFGKAKDRLGDAARAAKDLVVDQFELMWSPVQHMIDLVQSLIDKISNIKLPDITPGFDLPGLPKVLTRGKAGALPQTDDRRAGGGDTYVINLNGVLDTGSGVDQLVKVLNARARRVGGTVVLA